MDEEVIRHCRLIGQVIRFRLIRHTNLPNLPNLPKLPNSPNLPNLPNLPNSPKKERAITATQKPRYAECYIFTNFAIIYPILIINTIL